MGCLRRLGCLLLILVIAVVAAWLTRDRWLRVVPGFHRSAGTAASATWEPLTAAKAERARQAVARLGAPRGPVFANLTGAEAASYIYRALGRDMPQSADSAEAAVIGERLYLRASVRVDDLGGRDALGPLASLLGDRERVQFGGTFDIVRPGMAEFEVKEIRVHDIALPQGTIPRLLRRLEHGSRPAGIAPDALPLEIPPYIGDVRLARGRVTLYKTVGG